jgi:cardiolipin synthase
MHRAQHRHHGRIVVVDGEVAHTGGFGVADAWIAGEANEPAWRETNVRVEGPVVASMEGAFAAAWVEATGHLLAFAPRPNGDLGASREEVAPDGAEADAWAGLLVSGPGIGSSPAERYLALSLAGARKTLYLANPYFVPPAGLRALLLEAAARGVDARLLVPGRRTDVPSTRWAGRGYYSDLLEAGVRIWEYRPAMMHAKTLVADGSWVGIGSLNFDNRSLRLNDETVLLIQDPRIGARLDSLFLADLVEAQEILPSEHASRPIGQRLLEFLTRLAAPML